VQVGDLIRFRSSGVLATVIEYDLNTLSMKLFVHGDVLRNTPSSDGTTYMGIEKLRSLAEKV
jgi:hypothetical protein